MGNFRISSHKNQLVECAIVKQHPYNLKITFHFWPWSTLTDLSNSGPLISMTWKTRKHDASFTEIFNENRLLSHQPRTSRTVQCLQTFASIFCISTFRTRQLVQPDFYYGEKL